MKNNPRTLNTDYDAWLKRFQHETLKKLCEKLKIPLEDCLFNETIYGKKTYLI